MRCSYCGVVEEVVLWHVTPSNVNKHAPVDMVFVRECLKIYHRKTIITINTFISKVKCPDVFKLILSCNENIFILINLYIC